MDWQKQIVGIVREQIPLKLVVMRIVEEEKKS